MTSKEFFLQKHQFNNAIPTQAAHMAIPISISTKLINSISKVKLTRTHNHETSDVLKMLYVAWHLALLEARCVFIFFN